jgi:hypothetical protein
MLQIHDIEYFKINRKELFEYVSTKVIPLDYKNKVVKAPVKSGKRGMVEINCLLNSTVNHIFLSALHRKADKSQREELEAYGIKVFSLHNKNQIDEIDTYINSNNTIIHLDELDYGSGQTQLLSKIYQKYKDYNNVKYILYSATPEEAQHEFLCVGIQDIFFKCEPFKPPKFYHGVKKYLEKGKFKKADAFIELVKYEDNISKITITQQGKDLIKKLKEVTLKKGQHKKRHIAILRLAGNFKTEEKDKSQFNKMKNEKKDIENEHSIRLIFVGDKDEKINWDDEQSWDIYDKNIPFIFVINQVSGRSTEWKCHPYLVWYHTKRTEKTPVSTCIQDQERPAYYTTNYTDDYIDIEIYGDILAAEYSCGNMTHEEFTSKSSKKLSARVDTKKQHKNVDVDTTCRYNTWDAIPKEYTKNRKLEYYINEDFKLKKTMTIENTKTKKREEHEIPEWEKYQHLEGFYMTNLRSNRNKFIRGKKETPILFEKDIEKDEKEGINEKSRIRINVFYKDNETNSENYWFVVRKLVGVTDASISNTSTYNI